MCANYDPTAEIDFEAFSQFPLPNFDYPIETWKDYAAPILRKSADEYLTDPATFGMVPASTFRRDLRNVKPFTQMPGSAIHGVGPDRRATGN
jgi:hypothetical protein